LYKIVERGKREKDAVDTHDNARDEERVFFNEVGAETAYSKTHRNEENAEQKKNRDYADTEAPTKEQERNNNTPEGEQCTYDIESSDAHKKAFIIAAMKQHWCDTQEYINSCDVSDKTNNYPEDILHNFSNPM